MRLLLVAATAFEIDPLLNYLKEHFTVLDNQIFKKGENEIKVCISGIGIMMTTYNLLESIVDFKPDFALQAGVAGAFNKQLSLGDLLLISSEQIADLGAEDHSNFLDVFDLGLMDVDDSVFKDKKLHNPSASQNNQWELPFVSGITVNAVAGCSTTIKKRLEQYNCVTESMEGAPFHFVCLKKGIPFLQIRAISNFIEPRNKPNWQMKMAITNLNNWLLQSELIKGRF